MPKIIHVFSRDSLITDWTIPRLMKRTPLYKIFPFHLRITEIRGLSKLKIVKKNLKSLRFDFTDKTLDEIKLQLPFILRNKCPSLRTIVLKIYTNFLPTNFIQRVTKSFLRLDIRAVKIAKKDSNREDWYYQESLEFHEKMFSLMPKLRNLESLHYCFWDYHKNLPETLFPYIKKMTKLNNFKITLGDNSPGITSMLFKKVFDLTNLNDVSFTFSASIDPNLLTEISQIITKRNNLNSLELIFDRCAYLSDEDAESKTSKLISALKHYKKLKSLTIDLRIVPHKDNISTLLQLPSFLKELRHLSINNSICEVSDEKRINHQVFYNHQGLENLKSFKLGLSNGFLIDEITAKVIGNYLSMLRNLKELSLDISSNMILDCINEIFIGICSLTNLKVLKLNIANLIETNSVIKFNSFKELSSLEVFKIDLQKNRAITKKEFAGLCSSIKYMKKLRKLVINASFCNIATEQSRAALYEMLQELTMLKEFTLCSSITQKSCSKIRELALRRGMNLRMILGL